MAYPVSTQFVTELGKTRQKRIVKAEVWSANGLFLAALGDITAGSVTVNETATTRRTCSLTLVDPGYGNAGSVIPVAGTDLLHPASENELRLFRGIQYLGGAQEWVPLGVFRMSKPNIVDTGDSLTISITGSDRSAGIARLKWLTPYQIAAGMNLGVAIQQALDFVWPYTLRFNLAPTTVTLPATTFGADLSSSNDPWSDISGLASVAGMELFFDVTGAVVLRSIVNPLNVNPSFSGLYDERSGTNSVVEVENLLDETIEYNGVIVNGTGTGSTGVGPVTASVWNTNPDSPSYYNPANPTASEWGPVPLIVSTTAIPAPGQTQAQAIAQAQAMAQAKFILVNGQFNTPSFHAVPNPALQEGDVIALWRSRLGIEDTYVVSQMTIPLDVASPMTVVCRPQKASTLSGGGSTGTGGSTSPLVITSTSPLPGATVGVAYTDQLLATGGVPPYTWSYGTAGTNKTLAITTSSPVAGGTVGTAYSLAFAATGGTSPYTWTASGVPSGMSMSLAGVLSGTPVTAGTFTVTVTVTDSTSATASGAFSLTVVAQAGGFVSMGAPSYSGSTWTAANKTLDDSFASLANWNLGVTDFNASGASGPYVPFGEAAASVAPNYGGEGYANSSVNGGAYPGRAVADYDFPGNVWQTSTGPDTTKFGTFSPQTFQPSGWGVSITAHYVGGPQTISTTPYGSQTYYWTSGALNGWNKVYGPHSGHTQAFFQIKAQMPGLPNNNNGMWAALRFLGQGAEFSEIDLIETGIPGNLPNQICSHYQNGANPAPGSTTASSDLSQGYHIYGLEYVQNSHFTIYLDNVPVWTFANTDVTNGIYFPVLDAFVGGGWLMGPPTTDTDMVMNIAQIQVYER